MIGFDVDVERHGPIFDGRAQAAARQMARATEEELAEVAVNLVVSELGRVLQHPTGYYQSQIQTDRATGGTRVTDGGVVYGPWLEGVGSRNAPVTRFRGYSTFRRIHTRVDRQAKHIAERVMPRYLRRME
ncbi:hypothetical protein E1281_25920 [Actinomadura sp. KC345]|uniref:hypothetical protein n=1 Tax=Actinomadura sp. KC345 TaxID=2530371 RepID=UPI0010533C03|nr:hypothetical protein [Actinomadura sp. KC345]TDC47641.1 hypothetical protein E1281_25920 [Actinomadura sp. KC345]